MTLASRLIRTTSAAAAAAAASLCFAAPSQAAVHYLFEVIGDGATLASFEYTAPDFLTVDVTIPPGGLDSCLPVSGAACAAQEFHISTVGFVSGPTDVADVVGFGLSFAGGSGSVNYHYFANGAFGAVGVYNAMILDDDHSRLTVTQDAVPEPATWALMLLGFGAVGSALRRGRVRGAA